MESMEEFRIPKEAIERLKDPEVLRGHLSEGKTFQELLGYTNGTMEKFYSGAHLLYEQGMYQEAADAFVFLTTLNPYVHNFWLGLGLAEQHNEEYEAALVAYGMATMSDMDNPLPHYHSSRCHYLMGDYDTAVSMLDLAINLCFDDEKHSTVKSDAISAKLHIEKML